MAAIKQKYLRTLEGYLEWRGSGIFLRPKELPLDEAAPTAAESMKRWESEGKETGATSEPELLASYIQGKKSRDWHISEWKDGIRMELFDAEEFLGTLGCNRQNFESIFGHPIREDRVPEDLGN